jgi:rhodanese-related sulfurtransferase
MKETTSRGPDLWRGVLGILATGVVLGAGFNAIGLREERPWGVPWIAEDKVAAMPRLEAVEPRAPTGGPAVTAPVSDDPMAVPAGSAGLVEIPDLGRPVEIGLAAFKQYYDAGAVVVVDARDPEEFGDGHIRGAINLPYDVVATDPARLEAFDPRGKPIVTYCGGGTCEQSLSLAEELIHGGGHRRVLVFMDGFPVWRDAGYPVAREGERG